MERKKLRRSTLLFCFILIAIIIFPIFSANWNFSFDEKSDPEFNEELEQHYEQLFFWNETIN